MQLPPTLTSSFDGEEHGLGRTLYSRMESLGVAPLVLHTQYRLHPLLASIVNPMFYDGKLVDGTVVNDRYVFMSGISESDRPPLLTWLPTLLLLDTENLSREQFTSGGSSFNEYEASSIVTGLL